MTFGNILKKLRSERKYTRYELAEKLNVTYHTIAKYENDERLPDLNIIKNLSIIFKVSTDYLLGNDENPILNEQILIDYNNLSDKNKKIFEEFLELLKVSEKYYEEKEYK